MLQRIAVIEGTYKKAVEAGDKNIYFINGSEIFPKGLREMFTIDETRPNDLGHYYCLCFQVFLCGGFLNIPVLVLRFLVLLQSRFVVLLQWDLLLVSFIF